ncbi:MAG: hypothetical protein HUU21_21165 [Polyangiaceae bacterium]|nr:hypothetical protein [Polyangiaceae bacterium]
MSKIDEIKKHPKFPFREFGEDDEGFLMSQLYWLEIFKSVAACSPHRWEPWFKNVERDGNPIFSSVSYEMRRGVIIIQHAAATGSPESLSPRFVAWVDLIDTDPVIEHLTISSEISEDCEQWAKRLLHFYLVEGYPRQVMEHEIKKIEIEVESVKTP